MKTLTDLQNLLALADKATPAWKPDLIENTDAVVDYVYACHPETIREIVQRLIAAEAEIERMKTGLKTISFRFECPDAVPDPKCPHCIAEVVLTPGPDLLVEWLESTHENKS